MYLLFSLVMGYGFDAICQDCGYHYNVNEGGGFFFELLRCNTCGLTESIPQGDDDSEEGEKVLHAIRHDYDSLSPKERVEFIEQYLGRCICGGQYAKEAPIRCPQCYSTHYDYGNNVGIDYD